MISLLYLQIFIIRFVRNILDTRCLQNLDEFLLSLAVSTLFGDQFHQYQICGFFLVGFCYEITTSWYFHYCCILMEDTNSVCINTLLFFFCYKSEKYFFENNIFVDLNRCSIFFCNSVLTILFEYWQVFNQSNEQICSLDNITIHEIYIFSCL